MLNCKGMYVVFNLLIRNENLIKIKDDYSMMNIKRDRDSRDWSELEIMPVRTPRGSLGITASYKIFFLTYRNLYVQLGPISRSNVVYII